MAIPHDIRMGFGKFAEEKIGDVPARYLLWLYENYEKLETFQPHVHMYVEENYAQLEDERRRERKEYNKKRDAERKRTWKR